MSNVCGGLRQNIKRKNKIPSRCNYFLRRRREKVYSGGGIFISYNPDMISIQFPHLKKIGEFYNISNAIESELEEFELLKFINPGINDTRRGWFCIDNPNLELIDMPELISMNLAGAFFLGNHDNFVVNTPKEVQNTMQFAFGQGIQESVWNSHRKKTQISKTLLRPSLWDPVIAAYNDFRLNDFDGDEVAMSIATYPPVFNFPPDDNTLNVEGYIWSLEQKSREEG